MVSKSSSLPPSLFPSLPPSLSFLSPKSLQCLCDPDMMLEVGNNVMENTHTHSHSLIKQVKSPQNGRKYVQIIYMGLVSGTCKALLQLSNKNSPIKSLAKDMKRRFSKEDVQMASQHMKRASTSLVIRKMQVKTTMRYHFTPSRMAIMKRKIITSLGRGCGETEALIRCQQPFKMVQPHWKTVWNRVTI